MIGAINACGCILRWAILDHYGKVAASLVLPIGHLPLSLLAQLPFSLLELSPVTAVQSAFRLIKHVWGGGGVKQDGPVLAVH